MADRRDAGMPFESSAVAVGELIPHAAVKKVEKAAHGLYLTHRHMVLEEIVDLAACVAA